MRWLRLLVYLPAFTMAMWGGIAWADTQQGLAYTVYDNWTGQGNAYNAAPPLPPTTPVVGSGTVAAINHNWASGAILGTGLWDDVVVRYEGWVTAPAAQTYYLCAYSDDGFILELDDEVVINDWYDRGPMCGATADVDFSDGEPKRLVAWYYENGGGAVSVLRYYTGSGLWAPIPDSWYTTVPPTTTTSSTSTVVESTTSSTTTTDATTTTVAETTTTSAETTTTVQSDETVVTSTSEPPAPSTTTTTTTSQPPAQAPAPQPSPEPQPSAPTTSPTVPPPPSTETTQTTTAPSTLPPVPSTVSPSPSSSRPAPQTTVSPSPRTTVANTVKPPPSTVVDAPTTLPRPPKDTTDATLVPLDTLPLPQPKPEDAPPATAPAEQGGSPSSDEKPSPAEVAQAVDTVVSDPANLTTEELVAAVEDLDFEELTEEQVEAVANAMTGAPPKVKKVFEETVDIFGAGLNDYVPVGSKIPVRQRRLIVAATTLVFVIPTATPTAARRPT